MKRNIFHKPPLPMPPYVDEGVINYDIYEDGVAFLGTASITLPNLSYKSITVAGAGIAGDVDAPILGHTDAMEITLNWRTIDRKAYTLSEPRDHMLDLRVARQQKHSGSANLGVAADKYVIVARPKVLTVGNLQPASEMGTSIQMSVSYMALYVDGRKMIEQDPYNFVSFINGVDYLADARRAMGRA